MVKGKRGAEESNIIIFIILALVVAGLVIFFSWGFFSTGSRLIEGNDPSVTVAVESCKAEMKMNNNAYCDSAKYVKIKGGGEMVVSCEYINNNIRKNSMNESFSDGIVPSCTNNFVNDQCKLIKDSGVTDEEYKKIRVNGDKCSEKSPFEKE